MPEASPSIAIIGAGPAGSALAGLLALRGMRPVVFDDDKRPELLVGESLIPSVIPVLRKLGKHISKHLIWGVEEAGHFAVR